MNIDELDRQIDEALAQYSAAEPLDGIERRILNRIHIAGPPRNAVQVRWALPLLATLAGFFLSVFIGVHRWPIRLLQHPFSARGFTPAPLAPAPIPQPSAPPKIAVTHHAGHSRRLPKKPDFFAPAPLTPGERALLSLVELHPAEAQQVFADLRDRVSRPIEIPAIEVPPLQEN